ncbi:IS91 family transposase ISTha3 [subsurface metagenome]
MLSGLSKSTIEYYGRAVAKVALHFKCNPVEIEDEKLESYLYELRKKHSSESPFYFNHAVFALRYLFKLYEQEHRLALLPHLKQSGKLPIVLNRVEVLQLLKAPKHLKSRVLLGLTYDSGLRLFEVQSLQVSDIDSKRKVVHVRSGKYGRGRYVPISDDILRGIDQYIKLVDPVDYLFNGQRIGQPMSTKTIQRLMKAAVIEAQIKKPVTFHSLRHTYATHFLEDTGDLFSLKRNMGHSQIKSTLLYVHVVGTMPRYKPYSPLRRLFDKARLSNVEGMQGHEVGS